MGIKEAHFCGLCLFSSPTDPKNTCFRAAGWKHILKMWWQVQPLSKICVIIFSFVQFYWLHYFIILPHQMLESDTHHVSSAAVFRETYCQFG